MADLHPIKWIDTPWKILAAIAVIVEALLSSSLFFLPREHTIYAVTICAIVLIVMIIGIVLLSRNSRYPEPPAPERIKTIIETALEAACRAVSLPDTPHDNKIRAFVFRLYFP